MNKITCLLVVILVLPAFSFAGDNGGNITFQSPAAGAVFFSHDYHTKVRGVKCAACHFQTFADASGSFHIKKEKLNKRDFCQHCHNGMKGFDAGSTKNCTRCHKK